MLFRSVLLTFILSTSVQAVTTTYNWDVSWINANPDGKAVRPVIAINGKWPTPAIVGNVGDNIVVNVNNKLGNESMSLHWHGLLQKGNNANDGTPMVAQCPIIPGTSYTYTFTLADPGTYWYHSHSPGQYMDGLRGPIIIHDPNSPYKGQYDSEIVMFLSDWYHEQAATLIPQYIEVGLNPTGGSEPVPQSALMNDQTSPTFPVVAGKTYFLRIINMSGFAQFFLHIDGHNFTIIETDGVYTQPAPAQDLYIATGQRYGVLLKTQATANKNFAILGSMDTDAFDPAATPPGLNPNVTGALVYDSTKPIPSTAPLVNAFNVIDDINLVPYDKMPLLTGTPDHQIVLGLSFFTSKGTGGQQYRAGFNNNTYIAPQVPSLYTALSAGADALNHTVYGKHADAKVLLPNQLVEIVINNYDSGPHPIHIHGHNVQVVARAPGVYTRHKHQNHNFLAEGIINTVANATALGYTNSTRGFPAIPMRRDTWIASAAGYTIIRFRANNPGTWFIHCHMEWHMEAGLLLTLVEDPIALQQTQATIPAGMQTVCKAAGIPLKGNAASNSVNYLNLTGQNLVPSYPKGALYP